MAAIGASVKVSGTSKAWRVHANYDVLFWLVNVSALVVEISDLMR